MSDKPLDVVVKRSEWSGINPDEAISRLFNSNVNKLCCLGFLCEALGITRADMDNKAYPYVLNLTLPRLHDKLIEGRHNSTVAGQLASLNDNSKLAIDAKEAQIHELGLTIGVNFIFED